MNIALEIQLLNILSSNHLTQHHIDSLQSAYETLSIELDNFKINQAKQGVKYCLAIQKVINHGLIILESKNNELGAKFLNENDYEIRESYTSQSYIIRELGQICNDAMAIVLQYLAVFSPKKFDNEQKRKLFKEFNPFSLIQFSELKKSGKAEKKELKEPKENPFSVLEWATIFYYANETKLLKESPTVVGKLKEFMSEHQIVTKFKSFKNMYYTANRRINQKNDYPIEKLEKIIPFLKEKYKQSVTKVENDITILEDYKIDN